MHKLQKIFLLFTLIALFAASPCFAANDLYLKWDYNSSASNYNGFPTYIFSIQSRMNEPVTILGYKLNRGNTLSIDQQRSDEFKQQTLNFGQSCYLFNAKFSDLVEVEIFTDRGNFTFNIQ